MAEPAAPGAHLRTPAEAGSGRGETRTQVRARRGAGSGHRPWAHALGVSAPRNAGTPRSRAGAGPAAPRFPAPGFTAGGRWSAAGKGLSRDTGSGQEPAAWDSPRSDEGEQQAPPGVTEGGLVPARALSALGTAETAARGPRARSPGRARIRSSRQRRRVRGAAPRQRPRRFGELSAPRSRVPQGSARPPAARRHARHTRPRPRVQAGAGPGGEAGAGALGRPGPSPSGPPDGAAAAPGKAGRTGGARAVSSLDPTGTRVRPRRRGEAGRPAGPLALDVPDGTGENGAHRQPALSSATATRSRRAAAGRGRRQGRRGGARCPTRGTPSPAGRSRARARPPGPKGPRKSRAVSSVALRDAGLGSGSQSGLDRQGEFV